MTPRTRVLTAVAAVAATAAAVLVVGPGYETAQVRMRSGTVWLASTAAGEATLVDGASAEVAGRVLVGRPGEALIITQHRGGALVLNQGTGTLSRVDSATQRITTSAAELPGRSEIVVKPAPDVLHAVNLYEGTDASVQPDTLKTGESTQLAETLRPEGIAADDQGRLWAVDDRTGDLVWLEGGERRTRSASAKAGLLTITGGRPALVVPERGTAELLSPETGAATRSVRTDLKLGDKVVVSGSAHRSRVLIADGTRGELIVCAFDAASCAAPLPISAPNAELGAPVEVGDRVVVPDLSTGDATIVDVAASRVVAQRQLFGRPTRFELLAHDGIVFFNDPHSATAGVLGLEGDVRTITKYAEAPAAGDIPPVPDPRKQADQVTKIDQRQQQPGLRLPGPTDGTSRTNQPPASPLAPAIVVRPGNRGMAGEEFDLVLAPQPDGAAAARWSFGDGHEAVGAAVRHVWWQPGAFTVRVTTTHTGKPVQAETTVVVDPAGTPLRITEINARRPKPVIGESVHISADVTQRVDKWEWTVTKPGQLAPEVSARTPEFDHVFAAPGTYTVALTVTAGGQTVQFSKPLTVSRGAVKAWGAAGQGQDKIPDTASSGVVAIDCKLSHCLALKSDGKVIAWGNNNDDQTKVPTNALSGVVAIATGGAHSLALTAGGAVLAWGRDDNGQSTVPEDAQSGVIAIAAGGAHSLALKSDGKVIAWGENLSEEPAVPDDARSGVIAIAASSSHNLALKSDGKVISWGGQSSPLLDVPPDALSGVVAIAAGEQERSLALKSDGSVIQWGFRFEEEPLPPAAAQSGVISFDIGLQHNLALKADGSVVGWGAANNGEASLPPQYDRSVLAISAGWGYSVAVVEDLG